MPKLTAEQVRNATAPGTIWDTGPDAIRGFGVRILPTGAKSFFINYRVNGRERRYTIGQFPTWSVAAARDEARELRRLIDQGRDPVEEKKERRDAPTIADLIARYIADHLPTLSPREHPDQRAQLGIIGEHLGLRRHVVDVHHGDIAAMHKKITETRGPVRANRILAACSKAFALSLVPLPGEAKPWRDAVAGNPCKGVPRNRETGRENFFSPAELARIADALAAYPARSTADCIKLIMLTGCRPREARLATWAQFDREPGYWIKPAPTTKQKRDHKLPLSPPALELIEQLRERRNLDVALLFPGRKQDEPLTALKLCWRFVRKHAGLGPNARLYDLRHSFASVGAGGGLSLLLIGKLLGHTQQRTTQRYAHLADDAVRAAADQIGAVITGAGKQGAEVTPIKGASGGGRS
jgi:integrase